MISLDQVKSWAAAGESETLELKRSTGQRRERAIALCGMLSHRGRRVLFGVDPDGRVVGQRVSDRSLEEVAQELGEIDPPVFPQLDRIAIGGDREVLVVTVGPLAEPPTEPSVTTAGKTPGRILELPRVDPELSIPQLAGHLRKSASPVERTIRKLREAGRLVRLGPDKGGRWKVLE